MSEGSRKLSPAELLAELQAQSGISSDVAAVEKAATTSDDSVPTKVMPNREPTGSPLASLDRAQTLLTAAKVTAPTLPTSTYQPQEPKTLQATGLLPDEIERLILKFLLSRGATSGRGIARMICLPYGLIVPLLTDLKAMHLLAYRNAAAMGDYEYALTDLGKERARRFTEESTYFGAAPVTLSDYAASVSAQTITKFQCTEPDLRRAFSDLIINQKMFDTLGPAINSGKGMFLFGAPGNGKTSIAERVTACFGSTVYVPRAIGIDGDIIRVFDPTVHEIADEPVGQAGSLMNDSNLDTRWVRIKRPTVVVGGELTMAELEIKQNLATKICEAPLQIKSNCGILVIDDFGRQRVPVIDLLNRWIVPLEKRYDFLNVPSGKKIQVPFDQLIIFSTNLEPKDLVDGAFLRRIPYKIEVTDPTTDEFIQLFGLVATKMGFAFDKRAVEYLLAKHYTPVNRPLRACQPRDLLLQVKNYCVYRRQPIALSPDSIDFACKNYFSVM